MADQIIPPKKSPGDYAVEALKTAVGTVPVAGSVLAELISIAIIPPYERKKIEWMESVAERIKQLESNTPAFKIADLPCNTAFQDAMFATTKSAMSTSSKLKLDTLLNALTNVALDASLDKISTAIFLNYVDKFTEAHIQICSILGDPNKHRRESCRDYETKESYRELINKSLIELDNQLIDAIVKDLHDNNLITLNVDDIDNLPPLFREGESCITSFGERFINFIKAPSIN